MSIFGRLLKLIVTLQILISDCANFCAVGLRNLTSLAAEDLFLRKQLALFKEREKTLRACHYTLAGRITLRRLAFMIESDSTRLSRSRQLEFPQFLVSLAKPILGGARPEYGMAEVA